jgi:C-terminal processing protease CtpA/Prc
LGQGLALAALALAAFAAGAEPASRQYAEDFDQLWKAVDQEYAYLDRPADWKRARERSRSQAAGAKSRAQFVQALESTLAELRDEHVTLSEHNAGSRRDVPSATDVWAQWVDGAAVVTAVRAGSVADVAGLHPGIKVSAVQGVDIERAVRDRLARGSTGASQRDWALRSLLAGPWVGAYRMEVQSAAGARRIDIERADTPNGSGPPVVARKIGEDRDLGYIRLKNDLDDPALVAHFDAALDFLKGTRAMILDLRETQGGGRPEVARALIGRFIEKESPWKARAARGKARVVDSAAPRGPFSYTAPLLVLVDRWTAGEGEALAVGLESAAKATLMGTAMAGLRGESRAVALRHTGITVRFPVERSYRVDGKPREDVQPALLVDLEHPSGGPGDPILYQALKHFEVRGTARPR